MTKRKMDVKFSNVFLPQGGEERIAKGKRGVGKFVLGSLFFS
jgi:hypothetical protein